MAHARKQYVQNTTTVSELVRVVQSTEWIILRHLTVLKVNEPALIFFALFEQN